jgi:hypothetical protein
MRQLEELDNLDISGCERAETMNLLELKAEDILDARSRRGTTSCGSENL